MAQVAIKGHSTRGKEVIEILEMLGGKNVTNYDGSNTKSFYFINNIIICSSYGSGKLLGIDCYTLEEFLQKFPYKIGDKVSSKYLKNYEVSKMEWESLNNRIIYKLQGMGWYSADELQPYKEETMKEIIKIDIPKGYEFAGVDDDNQQVVFEKIGYQYPKTYGECHELMVQWRKCDCNPNSELILCDAPIHDFCKLIVARNIYWKIAGEQMGLGKPWEPDWGDNRTKYIITVAENKIYTDVTYIFNYVLCFPYEEMRDAFYENFKDLIEQCKDLL